MKQFFILLSLFIAFPAAALDDLVGTTTGPQGSQGEICATVKQDVADDFANRAGARPGSVSECACRDEAVTVCTARACSTVANCTQPSRDELGLAPTGDHLVGRTEGPSGDTAGICTQVKHDVAVEFTSLGHPTIPALTSECNCWDETIHACSARACSATDNCLVPEV